KRANLAVDEIGDPHRSEDPVGAWPANRSGLHSSVADEAGFVPLPHSLQPEIVVDAAVTQNGFAGKRSMLKRRGRIRGEKPGIELDFPWGQNRREGRGRGNRACEVERRVGNEAD